MEFQINGVNYRTAKLSVFEQLKVSRKLLPVLAGMQYNLSRLITRKQVLMAKKISSYFISSLLLCLLIAIPLHAIKNLG